MNPPLQRPILTVDLLRHGEPDGGERYRGSVDDPLSPRGWQQMEQAAGGHALWEGIITSPLQRCAAFARHLGERLTLPVTIEPRFQEISFGRWEGHTREEILAEDPHHLPAFWRDPLNNPPPDGESLRRFQARVAAGWHALLPRHEGQHLLLVVHGGLIRVLLSHLLHIPLEHLSSILVPYACVTRIRVDRMPDGNLMPRLVGHHLTL